MFRRALAFKGLGNLISAKLDLCKVVQCDSRNMEVLKGLQEVERLLGCAYSVDHTLGSSLTTPFLEDATSDKQGVCDIEVIPEPCGMTWIVMFVLLLGFLH